MILVDSSIVIDIAGADPRWREWSSQQLALRLDAGAAIVDAAFAEVAVSFATLDDARATLAALGLRRAAMTDEGLWRAAGAFRAYRRAGGSRSSPLPGFFIGGQASASGWPLLTRDVGRYRSYFPEVALIAPEGAEPQRRRSGPLANLARHGQIEPCPPIPSRRRRTTCPASSTRPTPARP